MDDPRALLDQLMGKDRDVPLDRRVSRRMHFSDTEVCKHALAGLCPFGLFLNTRSDLGPCEYEVHEDHISWEQIKGEYDAISEREKERYGYERALLRLLQRLVAEMDRKIEKAQERARLESMPKPLKPEQQAEIDSLRQQAKELTERSEKLAEGGDVDGSMAAVAQADKLRGEADKLATRYTQPDRFMEVCEVCGVFIQSTDNEARRRDHLEGKQYLGWLAIRDKHSQLAQKYAGGGPAPAVPLREAEEGEVAPGSGEERRHRSRSRERRRRSRSRDRGRRYDERRDRREDGRRSGYDRRDVGGRGYNAMPPPDYSRRGGRY